MHRLSDEFVGLRDISVMPGPAGIRSQAATISPTAEVGADIAPEGFFSRSEQILDPPRGHRLAEVVALHLVAVVRAQERDLLPQSRRLRQ